jgi:hypothetical protein
VSQRRRESGHRLGLSVRYKEQHTGLICAASVGLVAAKESLSLQLNDVSSLHCAEAGVGEGRSLGITNTIMSASTVTI